ncbi:hypothetical protein H0H93_013778, partial [Arthromyces matolae]
MMGEVNAVFGVAPRQPRIGTGMQPNITLKPRRPHKVLRTAAYLYCLFQASVKIMTDTQATHDQMQGLFCGKENVYHRFNVGVPVGDEWASMIELDDHHGIPRLVALMDDYLAVQVKQLAQAAKALSPSL